MAIPPNQLGDITAETGTSSFVMTGTIVVWPNASDPSSGWLRCNGASYSQSASAYNALYTRIGTTFNLPGDPAGTFRVPNLTQRIPLGAGNVNPAFPDICGAFAFADGSGGIVIPPQALPPHKHTILENIPGVINSTGLGVETYQSVINTEQVGLMNILDAAGNIQPIQNLPIPTRNPYMSANYLIKL